MEKSQIKLVYSDRTTCRGCLYYHDSDDSCQAPLDKNCFDEGVNRIFRSGGLRARGGVVDPVGAGTKPVRIQRGGMSRRGFEDKFLNDCI